MKDNDRVDLLRRHQEIRALLTEAENAASDHRAGAFPWLVRLSASTRQQRRRSAIRTPAASSIMEAT
ncbi:hypothetical protein GCM10022224_070670 [Nonomuraea antimicrobica]|uniref:Uncharacterized protein n=1 Tax=Nonomuraea antimicrobica TaxID=561173 RepID=A0ABP7CWH6_9ACTN